MYVVWNTLKVWIIVWLNLFKNKMALFYIFWGKIGQIIHLLICDGINDTEMYIWINLWPSMTVTFCLSQNNFCRGRFCLVHRHGNKFNLHADSNIYHLLSAEWVSVKSMFHFKYDSFKTCDHNMRCRRDILPLPATLVSRVIEFQFFSISWLFKFWFFSINQLFEF